MLATGVIMRWYHPWPLWWRTGATFVHDWLALAAVIVILGHVWMALRDWDALRAMTVRHHQPVMGEPARTGVDRGRGWTTSTGGVPSLISLSRSITRRSRPPSGLAVNRSSPW